MSFDGHLIHTCTIENPAAGGAHVYNNPTEAYGTPVTGVRCRLVEVRERVWSDEQQASAVQSVYKLLVRGDVTLDERAKISLVTLEERLDLICPATNAGAHKNGSELPANNPRKISHCATRLCLFTIYRRTRNRE